MAWITSVAVIISAIAVNATDDNMDPAELMTGLAQAREQRLADLHQYAEQGVFPHNHGNPGQRIPYFMDRHGRLCAVGFLIAKSMAGAEWDYPRFMSQKNVARRNENMGGMSFRGEAEFIQKREWADRRFMMLFGFFNGIAKANNNVRIKDVHGGPVLDWILRSGLMQEEAALIQPGYSYLTCDVCRPGTEEPAVSFAGGQTMESKHVEEQDRVRIRAHLLRVEKILRRNNTASLKTCAARLKARGPVWSLKLELPRL